MEGARSRGPVVPLSTAVLAISFASLFFRNAAGAHPLVVAGGRLLIAGLVLSPLIIRRAIARELDRRTIAFGFLCGAFYALHFGSWVASLSLTSVAASVTLVTATPIVLGIVGLATGRDRPEVHHWQAISLGVIGLGAIAFAHGHRNSADALVGDALSALGALAMAGYLWSVRRWMLNAPVPQRGQVLTLSAIATVVGAVLLLVSALVVRASFSLDVSVWGWIALAAIVPQLIGHTLLTISLRRVRPVAVGIATIGEPVLATLWAWIFLDEALTPLVGGGCALTLMGVVLLVVRRRR